MIFEVDFKYKPLSEYPINIPSRHVGLNYLDRAREETGVKDLCAEKVAGEVSCYRRCVSMGISEEIARTSGHFLECGSIEVTCKGGHLNLFVSDVMVVKNDDTTGEIKSVSSEHQLDEQAVLDAWREAGYPLEWK